MRSNANPFWTFFHRRSIGVSAALAFTLACLTLLTGCNLSGSLGVTQAINAINKTRDELISHGGDWQRLLTNLSGDLERSADKTVKDAAQQVKQITQEAIQLSGQEINCRVDIVDKHIDRRLDQITHILQKDYHTPALPPQICSVAPSSIDLHSGNLHELSVSGAFFFNAPKPTIQVLGLNDVIQPVSGDYISRVTDYEMRVNLDALRAKYVNTQTKRVLLLVEGSPGAYEVPVVQAASCSDGIKNQDETDVDCGGKLCAPCRAAQACVVDTDCEGAACNSGRCGFHRVSTNRVPTIRFGGSGGNSTQTSACAQGSVAVGFAAKTGDYFDSVGLFCEPLQRNGSVSGGFTALPLVGGGGGQGPYSSSCPQGRVLRGFAGKNGSYIDQMQGLCTFPRVIAARSDDPGGDSFSPTINVSNPGGQDFRAECDRGQALVALTVKSGQWMDSAQIVCASIDRTLP